MKNLTLEEHRRRIENIRSADRDNKKYCKRHRVEAYMPGQATYNLGDYPARFSIEPTEYDYEMLKELSQNGVELIQLHEEWNDGIRHLGADKFTSHDPRGLLRFVDLCHSFGIKVIPYISTGYFQVTDPDFNEKFARGNYDLISEHFHYRKCWAGSPEWRNYVLPRTFAVLDQYGFDGIYNDWGYDGAWIARDKMEQAGIASNSISVYDMPYDPDLEDLLSTVYTEVKRRGGVYKLHCDRNNQPPCKDKVYDYLWIGECVQDNSYGIGKSYEGYVVPCQHAEFSVGNAQDYYAKVIPFMQFPLLKRGRPLTGRGIHEDVPFTKTGDYYHLMKIEQHLKEHPNGPYTYSLWSSIPDDVEDYPRWCRYLALYRPMVTQNSVVYIELRECADILSPLPEHVYASMFVNEKKYMVVSNLTNKDYSLQLRTRWIDRVGQTASDTFVIRSGTILFLVEEQSTEA